MLVSTGAHIRTLILRCTALILAFAISSPPLFAQPQQAANRNPWRIFAPYFRLGTGYSSTILVRNRHLRIPATVTPIVYTTAGTDVRLPAVNINPNSVRAISIEEELRAASSWADSGAVALEYHSLPAFLRALAPGLVLLPLAAVLVCVVPIERVGDDADQLSVRRRRFRRTISFSYRMGAYLDFPQD
jgi:hypothetical protein